MNRRIDITEFPLIGRDLPIRMQVPLAQEQQHLLLGKARVSLCKRQHVKRRVPGREPRVLPLVWHGEDVAGEEMLPIPIPSLPTGRRRRRIGRITLQPILHDVLVKLLRPQQACMRLPLDLSMHWIGFDNGCVKRIRFSHALRDEFMVGR